ncbi:helix-turn-helix domain-containing protein [Methylobacter sp. S3L5C]|uniref:helix-turn-helix domain-containing protein n=1 Tax=Methylobacter sp. S3L5C TaxID=2839024 RepID=UPI001FAE3E3C|nr:helix-turn-helix domain-containing protein [Methylobacter sp. S3L5C]UOA06946.1 helix-turn-helix domain-containing protein [Methylobacter sp. S3L5C]
MAKTRSISLDENIIVDTSEASILICTPEKSLIKWRSTGEHNIPFIKIGRNVRYRTKDLREWIEKHVQGGVA